MQPGWHSLQVQCVAIVFGSGICKLDWVTKASIGLGVEEKVPREEIISAKINGKEVAHKIACKEESTADDGTYKGSVTQVNSKALD